MRLSIIRQCLALLCPCLAWAVTACGGATESQSGENAVTASKPSLFDEDGSLRFEVRAPFKKLNGPSIKEGDLQPGEVVIDGRHIPIKIGPRGRTSFRECTFRKLEAEVSETNASNGTPFGGLESFKIGTHCDLKNEVSLFGRLGTEQAVYRERLAYRWYQEITPMSLRTRRAIITYVSTDAPGDAPITKQAFVLEDFKTFRKRIGGEKVDVEAVDRKKLDQVVLAESYLLQLLVDNSDWQIGDMVRGALRIKEAGTSIDGEDGTFNYKVFRLPPGDVPLPYDFDIAGVVVGDSKDKLIGNSAFLHGEPKQVREQAFHFVGFWRLFPDASTRSAAINAVLKARAGIEKATEDAEIDAAGRKIARARQKAFFDALLTIQNVKILDRGPLTLFDKKVDGKAVCTHVNGGDPVVVVDETPGRIGFRSVTESIDDAQCETLSPGEFATVGRTFFVERERVITPKL